MCTCDKCRMLRQVEINHRRSVKREQMAVRLAMELILNPGAEIRVVSANAEEAEATMDRVLEMVAAAQESDGE